MNVSKSEFLLLVEVEKRELSRSDNNGDEEKARLNALFGWDLSKLEESLKKAETFADIDQAFTDFAEGSY